MIETIVVCEYTSEDFKPINKKNSFLSSDFSVQILVKLGQIKKDTTVNFHWYINNQPNDPIGIYEIPLSASQQYPRFAVGALEISHIVRQKDFNAFQKWFVLVVCDDEIQKVEFEIKALNSYNPAKTISSESRFTWNA